jgi:hypothetical protein
MAIAREQDHALLPPRADSVEEEEETQELFGPQVMLSEEDQANDAKKLPLGGVPLDRMRPRMSWTERLKVWASHARYRIAYYKVLPTYCVNQSRHFLIILCCKVCVCVP